MGLVHFALASNKRETQIRLYGREDTYRQEANNRACSHGVRLRLECVNLTQFAWIFGEHTCRDFEEGGDIMTQLLSYDMNRHASHHEPGGITPRSQMGH